MFEAPDEQTGAALLLKLSAAGFVRTQTLRVYDADEFQQVLEKM
ncbi:MAG: GYD domain-containing protein [Aeoliella sp.]